MNKHQRLRAFIETRSSVDLRALAAFRAGLGLVLLIDIGLRSGDLVAFYTDAGILPRSILFELYPTIGHFSLHA
ncbi:MAG: HTTM domain-containing protein, partial [Halobacteriaceae archaeon]